jgi:hypothetical protein
MTILMGLKLNVADMQNEIKKKLSSMLGSTMKSSMSLCIFCNSRMLQPNRNLSDLYDKIRDEDGFVYITYA